MDILKSITIEPVMFLSQIGDTMVYVIFQNLYIDKICRVDLGYDGALCDLYSQSNNNFTDSDEFAPLVNDIQVASSKFVQNNTVIDCCLQILLVLLLGVWSDRTRRRKPALVLAQTGKTLRLLGLILNSYFMSWPSWVLLLATLIHSMGGGLAVIQMAAYSYISSSSNTDSRTWRIGLVEMFWYLGAPLGLLGGAYFFQVGGYLLVFGVACLAHFVSLLYAIFILPEVRTTEPRYANKQNSIKQYDAIPSDSSSSGLFDSVNYKTADIEYYINNNNNDNEKTSLLPKSDSNNTSAGVGENEISSQNKESNNNKQAKWWWIVVDGLIGPLRLIIKWRPHNLRLCLFALILIWILNSASSAGEVHFKYLFTRNAFDWREQEYSTFSTFTTIVHNVGLVIVMPICSKLLGLSDPLAGTLGALATMSSRLCWALAPTSLYLYIGAAVDVVGCMVPISARALFSKCVAKDESGRIFSLLGLTDAVIPMVAISLYSFIFTSTLTTLPSAIFFTSAGMLLLIGGIFIIMFICVKFQVIRFPNVDAIGLGKD